jgi:hypothetical protein
LCCFVLCAWYATVVLFCIMCLIRYLCAVLYYVLDTLPLCCVVLCAWYATVVLFCIMCLKRYLCAVLYYVLDTLPLCCVVLCAWYATVSSTSVRILLKTHWFIICSVLNNFFDLSAPYTCVYVRGNTLSMNPSLSFGQKMSHLLRKMKLCCLFQNNPETILRYAYRHDER